jgi:hypothetical protein
VDNWGESGRFAILQRNSTADLCSRRVMWRFVEEIRDAIYYEQMARVARLKAAASADKDISLRLREAAIRNERKARQLRRYISS